MHIKIRDTQNATEWVLDLLNEAVREGMTDIQLRLNRDARVLTVRARVNRVMADIASCEGPLAVEAINRIKTMAKIPTGPAQAIADGLYEHDTGFSKHELRVALFPSVGGEAVALRLPANQEMPVLADVKFNEVNLVRVQKLLGMANGLLLMAGPMGAGKTTSMYAMLGALGGPDRNVFTVEDPVERVVPGAVQIQINENSRNGWPDVLRGLRRSDLEVLMIGEVRDGEQASAALEIGNAGAKVISSIHANDSVGAVHQLLELSGSSPRMLGNQLRGVVSQRLIRTLHAECSGAGCATCSNSGYQGVIPIHEVLIVQDELVQAMVEGASASVLRDVAQTTGMETLWQAARRLITAGLTDEKEAVRALGLDPGAPQTPDIEATVPDAHAPPEPPNPDPATSKETRDEYPTPLPAAASQPPAGEHDLRTGSAADSGGGTALPGSAATAAAPAFAGGGLAPLPLPAHR